MTQLTTRGTTTTQFLGLSRVSRSFGGIRAVRDVSFTIPPTGITGLIGPNGAGKSTVINLICGVLRPDGGEIGFQGESIAGLPAHEVARRGITRTFQRSNLFGRLTVMENLLAGARSCRGHSLREVYGRTRRWRADEAAAVDKARDLLRVYSLSKHEDSYADQLSGGEKRMVELIRALMTEPTLLVLDEPIAGINPSRAIEIGEHLLALAANGLAMLLVEHDLAFVDRVCDRVVVMAQGSVLAEGSMEEMRNNEAVVDAYLS